MGITVTYRIKTGCRVMMSQYDQPRNWFGKTLDRPVANAHIIAETERGILLRSGDYIYAVAKTAFPRFVVVQDL